MNRATTMGVTLLLLVILVEGVHCSCWQSLATMGAALSDMSKELSKLESEIAKLKIDLADEKNKTAHMVCPTTPAPTTTVPTTTVPTTTTAIPTTTVPPTTVPPTTTTPIPTTTPTPIPTTVPSMTTTGPRNIVYECSFENPIKCGSIIKPALDNVEWDLGQGQVSSTTGPSTDHTTGTAIGQYYYINGTKIAENNWFPSETEVTVEFGQLQSVNIEKYMVTFWYMMNGKDVKELKVYIKRNQLLDPVAAANEIGDQGKIWKFKKIEVPNVQGDFSLVFKATSNAYQKIDMKTGATVYISADCDIAIDDIVIENITKKKSGSIIG